MTFDTFFDHDHVECLTAERAMTLHPELSWEAIDKRFVFPRDGRDIICLQDLLLCIRLHDDGLQLDDVQYMEVAQCSVCRAILLPADEAYVDERTGDVLCDAHSRYDEVHGTYHKAIFG